MRKVILLLAVASLTAGAAQATTPPPRAATGDKVPAVAVTKVALSNTAGQAQAPRQLVICNEDEDARLVAPGVDYGFVTAKQVLAGRTWTGAKCITASEARKLTAAK